MNIWEIQQGLLSVFEELEENGGELTPELEEKLSITQDSFKSKCESYVNVIKAAKADIAAIDQETKRLAELKKSKNTLIDRLSKIMIEAINMFGDTSKSGSRFIDYGTGKLSIRSSQKVELDDNKLECMANEYAKCVSFERMLGDASNRHNITFDEMIQRCKEHKHTNTDVVYDDPYDITRNDIEYATFNISINVCMEDMICSDGYHAIKKICEEFGTDPIIIPNINKTQLKTYLNTNPDEDITFGKLTDNKTLTIK